jgi:hypothetical protein
VKFLLACIPILLWICIPAGASIYFAIKGDGLFSLLSLCFGFAFTTLLFTFYYWFYGARDALILDPSTTMNESRIRTSLGLMSGILVPLLIFGGFNEISMQLPTLFEKDLKGSTELKNGNKIAWNKEIVIVEHPGVEHTISIWPRGEGIDSDFKDVEIFIKVLDKNKKVVLDGHNTSKGAKILQFKFLPEEQGEYLFLVTAGTPDVPGLHIWITDPKKNNGRRNIS